MQRILNGPDESKPLRKRFSSRLSSGSKHSSDTRIAKQLSSGPEGASIYPVGDERCKHYFQHINPVIENELLMHKVHLEKLFTDSLVN